MEFTDICEETWTNWKKKRRKTLIGFLFVAVAGGMDYSFMFTTLYLYLKEMVKVDRPAFFYGLIFAVFNLSSMTCGTFFGRWVDKTRKIKLCAIFMLAVQIIGCLLYVIYFNVGFLVLGRLIGGLGGPFVSVISGEIIRIYDKEESTRALWWVSSTTSLGAITGPVIVLFFKDVDFYIGSIHMTQLNFIGIFMAGILLVTLVVIIFLIHDCSAEIDVKEYLNYEDKCNSTQKNLNTSESTNEESSLLRSPDDCSTIPIKVVLKHLFTNADALLMFISTFVFFYNIVASDLLLPLVTSIILHWRITPLTFVMVGSGLFYVILTMVMSKFCNSARAVYIMSIICISAQILMFVSLILMKILPRDFVRDVILMVLVVLFWTFAWVIEEVLIRCILAKMVPSTIQSFTETLRNGVSRASAILASFTAPLIVPYLHYWSSVLLVIDCILLVGFIIRKQHLINVKEIDFMPHSPRM